MIKNILRVLKIKEILGEKESNDDFNALNKLLGGCSLYRYNDITIGTTRYIFGTELNENTVDVKFIALEDNNANIVYIIYYTTIINEGYSYHEYQELITSYFDKVLNTHPEYVVEYMVKSIPRNKLTLLYR